MDGNVLPLHVIGLQLEGFAFLRPLDAPAPDALNADAHPLNGAVFNDLDTLQVGAKSPPCDARGLTTDAAQVFCFAAPGNLVAQRRLLPANRAMHTHPVHLSPERAHLPKTPNIAGFGKKTRA